MKSNRVLLNELLQLYFCMLLNFDKKCSKWPWLLHWYLPRVVFCILFHIFQLLVNFTEGSNIMGFLPPQMPHMLFHYNSTFHSSFFLQHNMAIGLSSLLTLSPEYLHVPWVPRKRSSKILSLLYIVYGLCLSFQFTRNGLAEELHLVWPVETPLPFSGAAMVYSSKRPGGLQLLLTSSATKWSGDLY